MSTIRKATLSDLDQLTNLFDQYRVFYRKESDPASAKRFLNERLENQDSVIFVAEENGALLGFTQLYPLFSSARMKKIWLLNDLYVNGNFRGRGISLALIEKAKDLCRTSGAAGMSLETEKSNVIGNQLYPRAGFVLNDAANFYDWNV